MCLDCSVAVEIRSCHEWRKRRQKYRSSRGLSVSATTTHSFLPCHG